MQGIMVSNKQLYSTETALKILTAMDSGNVTALPLLDLSAAVDTIDHSILQRVKKWYGAVVISWLKSICQIDLILSS